MEIYNKNALKRARLFRIGAIIFCCAMLVLMAYNDYCLYDATIAKIVNIDETFETVKDNDAADLKYSEGHYNQSITALVKNGENKGKTISLRNHYAASCVYDDKYSKGNDVFVEKIEAVNGVLSGTISGKKRDQYVAGVIVVLVGLLAAISGKKGIFVAASLAFNLLCFYYVLRLYEQGINLFMLSIPIVIIFSAITLYFISGWSKTTFVSFASTLLTVAIVTGISAVTLHTFKNIDYDFMEFLPQPYYQLDAQMIFLSEILIGSLGAIMDVAITMTSTIKELVKISPEITSRELIDSCRRVGDDLLGSMVNVMFLTNMASGIPFFVLCMRNGIMLPMVIKYHVFFEIARFLTGSIGVVLAIPISGLIARYLLKERRNKC